MGRIATCKNRSCSKKFTFETSSVEESYGSFSATCPHCRRYQSFSKNETTREEALPAGGAAAGVVLGAAVGGPFGAVLGGLLGGLAGGLGGRLFRKEGRR